MKKFSFRNVMHYDASEKKVTKIGMQSKPSWLDDDKRNNIENFLSLWNSNRIITQDLFYSHDTTCGLFNYEGSLTWTAMYYDQNYKKMYCYFQFNGSEDNWSGVVTGIDDSDVVETEKYMKKIFNIIPSHFNKQSINELSEEEYVLFMMLVSNESN